MLKQNTQEIINAQKVYAESGSKTLTTGYTLISTPPHFKIINHIWPFVT